jgi:hypothetical protein
VLSVLCHIWAEARAIGVDIKPLSSMVRWELEVTAGLVLACQHDASRGVSDIAFVSDLSTKGYVLLEGGFDTHDLIPVM